MASATVGLLQSNHSKWKPTPEKNEVHRKIMQDSTWADGLRGIAAVYVMFSHMTLAFARYIVAPCISDDGPSHLMQKPIFRLVAQGSAWVALFIILSGFVNALRPIKLAQTGQVDAALSNLSTSAFRRSFRLFLPSLAATVGSWVMCQMGAYEVARNSDAYWLSITSPKRSQSWGTAIDDLIRAVANTWTFNPNNSYDQPQWALLYLLMGSTVCFSCLLTVVNLTSRYRVLVLLVLWRWGFNWDIKIGAPFVAVGIFTGILLAELHHSEIPLRFARYSPLFTPPLLIASLVFMSFPAEYQRQCQWTRFLFNVHYKIFPDKAFLDRTWPTMGSALLCFTIIMSPHLRRALSHRVFLWLGKISFPLYLLHGSFMRSLLTWLLFSRSTLVEMEEKNGNETYVVMRYPLPSKLTFAVVLPIFFPILFFATHMWANKVEPHFGAITKVAEDVFFGKRQLPRPAVLPFRQD